MIKDKKKILLFGAGKAGERSFNYLHSHAEIVAFADNNSAIHGSCLCDKPIISPQSIAQFEFDEIHISSMYQNQIRKQLITEIGIAATKIKLVENEVMIGLFEHDKRPLTFSLYVAAIYLIAVTFTAFYIA